MSKINFLKMSGAGNDFIVIDADEEKNFHPEQSLIAKLCCRRNGVGADGLITVARSNDADFLMQYFNSDGSTGSLCGNGARCAIKFAGMTGKFNSAHTKFISNGKIFKGEIIDADIIKFYLNSPKDFKFDLKIDAGKQVINGNYVDTGSPHVVIKCDDVVKDADAPFSAYGIDDLPVYKLGKEIRYHNLFMPGGTNVNFIEIKDDFVFIRTYERGVEDETLACGTGSTAAAIIAFLQDGIKPPVKLVTHGGDNLIVDFNYEQKNINNISLTGPAKVTFTGSFLLHSYL